MTSPSDFFDWLIVLERKSSGSRLLSILRAYHALWKKTGGSSGSSGHTGPDQHVRVLGSNRSVRKGKDEKPGDGVTLLVQHSSSTLQAIYRALTQVAQSNPNAFVVVCPSDRARCLDPELSLVRVARDVKNRIVLLGTFDERFRSQDTLIQTGGYAGYIGHQDVWMVNDLLSCSADILKRRACEQQGIYWNTSVLAAPVQLLLSLGFQQFPELLEVTDSQEARATQEKDRCGDGGSSERLSSLSFDRDVIARYPWQAVMMEWRDRCRRQAVLPPVGTQNVPARVGPSVLLGGCVEGGTIRG